MAEKIFAVLEQREGVLKRASFETAAKAASLAADTGGSVTAVVPGGEISNIEKTAAYGITKVVHLKNAAFEKYTSTGYAKAVAEYAAEQGADLLLLPNTAWGKDLAPHLAAALDAGIIMDCTGLKTEDGTLKAVRPVFAGKALQTVEANADTMVVTLRPNTFAAQPADEAGSAEIETVEVNDPDLRAKVIELQKSEGKLDVSEADIIVSGGRGLKEPDNFHLVEELAEALGAAVGASRAVVDAGWRPHSEQVGQTGKTVSPSLYVACGISGAIQHLAGMSSSKYIVAVNKDPDAPIFKVADYGITGDVFEILPALTEEIKKAE